MTDISKDEAERFIARWTGVTASELSTAQSFAADLCRLLGVDTPHPDAEQQYMFERPIKFHHGDGSTSDGRIDLYRRGAFVLESKKLRLNANTKGFDDAMLRARSQAEQYARALPASEGRPPFLIVIDVGNRIELYAEFSRSGATYTPFPDPRSHRIALADLADTEIRERLRKVWTDPLALDPSRESARVTREIAARLATLARSLEGRHAPEIVAQFLMRCLFTMFAEDVRLLPAESFRDLLLKHADNPDVAMRMLGLLWRDMDSGGFSGVLATDVLRFNGKLFKNPDTLPLDKVQLALLIDAARADWTHVEPAIFGTLLERALSPGERHKLGAHYTPRAYVERLVLPTVIEPLRAEWSDTQAAALTLAAEGKADEAVSAIRAFHHRLCTVRVLDPACGSGNFLYVTLEHLKRLEGEVLNALDELGFRQTGLAIDGERADAFGGETVDPHQLLGIEINPRAAAIAEVVLWIGYLQWHFRTRGDIHPPQPVIRDFSNIENRDAVLACDRIEIVTDERGIPVTRWDGVSMKKSPVTGEDVPDDTKRIELERYVNPRKAVWPQADFVVGNPPFIGNKRMRSALGDGYVEALRGAWPDVPESADFVMYWWHHAATQARLGVVHRFGLITTNSIRQTFNRRVIEYALALPPTSSSASSRRKPGSSDRKEKLDRSLRRHGEREDTQPLSLVFAIPDHPWVDAADGAAVRIAMTVAARSSTASGNRLTAIIGIGRLQKVEAEIEGGDGEIIVQLSETRRLIHPQLFSAADVASAKPLRANRGLCWQGCKLVGAHFQIDAGQRAEFVRQDASSEQHLPRYTAGSDLMRHRSERFVIDSFGLEEDELRVRHPSLYQHLKDYVFPERAHNNDPTFRTRWWLMGRPRPEMRSALAGLASYLVTSEVSKHRVFTVLNWPSDLVDGSVITIASSDSFVLGAISAESSVVWSAAAGGTLEDRPRFHTTTCFDALPFPSIESKQAACIRNLAEQLDAHRKRQQAAHPDLTLTGMYNVLEKLRSGEVLTAKERVIHEHGLVSVLRQLHDEIDAAVLDAYGWSDLLPRLRIAHGNDPISPLPPGEGAPTGAGEGSGSRDLESWSKDQTNASTEAASSAARHHQPPNAASVSIGEGRAEAKRAFDEAILERLVALNAERAAEEARGLVRWLRPEFQNPSAQTTPQQSEIETGSNDDMPEVLPATSVKPQPWPNNAVEQVRAVADVLTASPIALSIDEIALRFTARGAWKKRLPSLLAMLITLGRAREHGGRYASV